MYDPFSTIKDENANPTEVLSGVKLRHVAYKLHINDAIWRAGPLKFAQGPAWSKDGIVRPTTKRGLPGTHNTKWLKKNSPFKNFQMFPSANPYPSELRQVFRLLKEENHSVARAHPIRQQLVFRQ